VAGILPSRRNDDELLIPGTCLHLRTNPMPTVIILSTVLGADLRVSSGMGRSKE